MKKVLMSLLLPVLVLGSCNKQEIEMTESGNGSGSGSTTPTVTLEDPKIAWSESSLIIMPDQEDFVLPTLSNPNHLPVTYASSNQEVATIGEDGKVTVLYKIGSTSISANFAGDDTYQACTASYALVVTDGTDDGAVATQFSSAGSGDDDDIAQTGFSRLVTVTYSGNGATVSGYSAVADVMTVSVNGAQVTIDYTGTENVVYKLSGSSANGLFKLYSSKKQALWLSGLTLTNPSGAAIDNQSGKRTFVYIEGTNSLADGSGASYATSGDEDQKAVFFSEGQLIFSGPSGGTNKLTVTANNAQSKSGIASDDYVRMLANATVSVTAGSSAGHGIKANDYVQLSGGTLDVTTRAAMKKGIKSDGYVLVEGGSATVNVSGGVAYDSEDGEYSGSACVKADNFFGMTGGALTLTNSGTGGKGIHAGNYEYYTENGGLNDSYISGGTLRVTTTGGESNDVSAKAVKIGFKEGSGRSYVYGGNLVISGGSIVISCAKAEGLEAKGNLTVSSGELYVTSQSDDAINCQGELNVTGGFVYGCSSGNDGIDTNGNLVLSGGFVYAVTTKGAPEVALDANTEGGCKLYINSGATLVAYGGLESGYSAAQNVYSMSCSAGNWNALHDGNAFIAAFKAPSGVSSVAVSAPSLARGYSGVSVGESLCNGVWAAEGISGGSAVNLGTYSGNQGGPGGGGHGGGHGGW